MVIIILDNQILSYYLHNISEILEKNFGKVIEFKAYIKDNTYVLDSMFNGINVYLELTANTQFTYTTSITFYNDFGSRTYGVGNRTIDESLKEIKKQVDRIKQKQGGYTN